jgi:hypothetical protein
MQLMFLSQSIVYLSITVSGPLNVKEETEL